MSLKVHGLVKNFLQGERRIEVLKGLTFEVSRGESLAIVGQSGSGKSTLLALLAGLDRPTAGEIWMDEREISSMGERELSKYRAEKIGIIFQQFHLMSDLTALENVALPLELARNPAAQSRATQALTEVGLEDRARHFARQLSGGECQRVAIARALVTRPRVILADEPTGNLDFQTAATVSDLMFELAKLSGSILILVTHSEELAKRCSRVMRLSQGLLK